tara:strand:+ start:317 stop:766 length:450 start_codon:yes stop_codon:yes gene_type:complete
MVRIFFSISVFTLIFILNVYSDELKITSNNLEVDRSNKISIFSGDVYVVNQNIKIWSEKLIVKFNNNENEIEEFNAINEVKIVKDEITATGDTGLYFPKSDVINLFGNVEVYENNNYVKCDELFLDIKNSTSIMKSTSSDRVEALINTN